MVSTCVYMHFRCMFHIIVILSTLSKHFAPSGACRRRFFVPEKSVPGFLTMSILGIQHFFQNSSIYDFLDLSEKTRTEKSCI